MAIRNFYLDFDIDGRKTRLTGGPRGIDGTFDGKVYLREEGGITTPAAISGRTRLTPAGEIELILEIEAEGFQVETHGTRTILTRTVKR